MGAWLNLVIFLPLVGVQLEDVRDARQAGGRGELEYLFLIGFALDLASNERARPKPRSLQARHVPRRSGYASRGG